MCANCIKLNCFNSIKSKRRSNQQNALLLFFPHRICSVRLVGRTPFGCSFWPVTQAKIEIRVITYQQYRWFHPTEIFMNHFSGRRSIDALIDKLIYVILRLSTKNDIQPNRFVPIVWFLHLHDFLLPHHNLTNVSSRRIFSSFRCFCCRFHEIRFFFSLCVCQNQDFMHEIK